MRKQRLLFLQLPCLDNDVRGPRENIPMGAVYLAHAVRCAPVGRAFDVAFLPPQSDDSDNATLASEIAAVRPDVIACTLYLWNIERTLRIMRLVRRELPGVVVVAGGPEVAAEHPFLFRSRAVDVAVVGEGELVLPAILEAMAAGRATNFSSVAWRRGEAWEWGQRPADPVDLARHAPPPDFSGMRPDAAGMAYIETTRGCPMRCTFCRYHHLRRRVSCLPPADVARRIACFAERGAREFKFTDPTFNSHPRFEEVLRAIAALNRDGRLTFFAEVRADTLTDKAADLLAAAHFTEIEIGLQSSDAAVLRAIRRPDRVSRVLEGVQELARRGIKVTLDVMYGLPRQTADDVYRSIAWGLGRANVTVQPLQTLLLPGTDLRRQAAGWGMKAAPLPPYGVYATATMSRADMRGVEAFIQETPGLPADSPAERYAGRRLPDLFSERVTVEAAGPLSISGRQNRRAVLLRGRDLYGRRQAIRGAVRAAVQSDPDMLWQFVLAPETEEPLNLIDDVAGELRRQPRHLLDRYANAVLTGRRSARRVFVQLDPRRRFDPAWVAAADELLASLFY